MRTTSPTRSIPSRRHSRAALAAATLGLTTALLAGCGSDGDAANDTADDTAAPESGASTSASPTPEKAPAPTITESLPPSIEPSGGIGGEPTDEVAPEEQQILDDFAAFAADPTPQTADALPFADSVRLGLGPRLLSDVSGADAGDAAAWQIDEDVWRAYEGPFSALKVIGDHGSDLSFGAGKHQHCASAPQPIAKPLRGMRHLWIQPTDTDSCLDWFTVDLYLNQGRIEAVTTDMFEP